MCGIFAIFNSTIDPDIIRSQFELGKRRGPEFTSFKELKNGYIGFHRLAINGINSKSNQPFNIDNCTLICNGEIYNFKKLYKELNITPETESDCEVIIYLYKKFGIEYTIELLDGVYAFILIDHIENIMYVVRDTYGVRPLFYIKDNSNTPILGFSSELKQLSYINNNLENSIVDQFPPGSYAKYNITNDNYNFEFIKNYKSFPPINFNEIPQRDHDYYHILEKIKSNFEEAVVKRVLDSTDRPIACLLSGGLDSSLVTSIVSKYVPNLETYSIGIIGGEDLKYAKIVAEHLKTNHTSIELTEDEFFDAIPEVIKAIESYDTTTVRASVGNYLVAKYISKHSKAKVIFNGDGSDELMGGYLYFNAAPNYFEFDKECKRLLNNIHYFDVLRSDRSISSNGLEARTPFLDLKWTKFFLSLPVKLRYHSLNNKCEKYLIREAFKFSNFLPNSILFRKKEAFSDGVSSLNRSWYAIIDEKIPQAIKKESLSDNWKDLLSLYNKKHNSPKTKEQLYYRLLFDIYYPQNSHVIPYYWMPKFVVANDSSARTLEIYDK